MHNIDNRTINEKGMPGILLMERAAITVAEEIMKDFPKGANGLVVVEGGNNGGDGLAAARILINAGFNVDVVRIGALSHETESFVKNRQILNRMGVGITDLNKIEPAYSFENMEKKSYDFIVEGIFGVGLTRNVGKPHDFIIRYLNDMTAKKYSIDIPAGVNADTGKIMGEAFRADRTITFGFNKPGLILYPGAKYAGSVLVKDIGFDINVIKDEEINYFSFDKDDLTMLPERQPDVNKGSCGKLSVIAGSKGMAGAAVLCTKAAYRMGIGMVKVYTHEKNRDIICNGICESLIMTYNDETSARECVRDAVSFSDTVLIGPGLSKDKNAQAMINELIMLKPKKVIADADALNIMADCGIMPESAGECVIITPHLKEMSRLTGISVDDINDDMPGAAKNYAAEHKLICVLKSATSLAASGVPSCSGQGIEDAPASGPGQRIEDAPTSGSGQGMEDAPASDSRQDKADDLPEKNIYIGNSGNDGMATAGSGDVLAGIISGLVASGMKPFKAAALGMYIHGMAGDEAALHMGKRSMLASDIINHIQDVLF